MIKSKKGDKVYKNSTSHVVCFATRKELGHMFNIILERLKLHQSVGCGDESDVLFQAPFLSNNIKGDVLLNV